MAAPFHNPWFFGHLATLSIRIICTSTCCKQMMSGWYLSPRRGFLWLSCFHNTAAWSWRYFLAIQPITLDTLVYEQPIYKNYIAYVCILYIYRLTHIHSTLQHIIHKYTFKWRRNQPSFILWRICHKGYGSFPWAACNKKTCWALNATSCRITRNRHLPTLHSQKTNPRVAPSQFKRMKIKPK